MSTAIVTNSGPTTNSSPLKRARKPMLSSTARSGALRLYRRGLISSPQERISSWFRRFDRWRKASSANDDAAFSICEKIRSAARGIRARWTMKTAPRQPTELLVYKGALDLFTHRHRALYKATDRAVELALAPVFFCCIALDNVSRPTTLPATSVFSASVITFVLKVFTIATELRQKHLPVTATSSG